jgi:hypothetical protein
VRSCVCAAAAAAAALSRACGDMNPHHCRLLLERYGEGEEDGPATTTSGTVATTTAATAASALKEKRKKFQSAFRWALLGALSAGGGGGGGGERAAWTDCLLAGARPLSLAVCYDNFINLLLLAACVESPREKAALAAFMARGGAGAEASSGGARKCLDSFIGQAQSGGAGAEEWRWAALCGLAAAARPSSPSSPSFPSFSTQQYIIQQAVRRLTRATAAPGWDAAEGAREGVNQAVFCMSKLFEVSNLSARGGVGLGVEALV